MGNSQYDPAMDNRIAWNAGLNVGAKRALKPRQIWAIRFFLDREGRMRDRALFDLSIDSKLRGCDLVKIKIGELVAGPEIRTRAIVVQQKTGKPVQFELMSDVRTSLLAWLQRRGGTIGDYAFPSRIDRLGHLSTRQYARLVDERVTAAGLRREEYGTHSLRRTKASIIYKATGNLRAVQILLGHTKIENTVRYLGVDVEDALTLAEGTEIRRYRLLASREEPDLLRVECRSLGRPICDLESGRSFGKHSGPASALSSLKPSAAATSEVGRYGTFHGEGRLSASALAGLKRTSLTGPN